MSSQEIVGDKFHPWTDKSNNIPFESSQGCVGHGELKLAKELDITTGPGGQNKKADLVHPQWGEISIKNMTKDNCRLGTECKAHMRKIFRQTASLFVCWVEEYESKCPLANKYYDSINKRYGSSRTTIIEAIDSFELSESNLQKLNVLLNELKQDKKIYEHEYVSLQSELINMIVKNLGDKSLQDLLDDCARKEATTMNLIIVHEKNGWLLVKDTSRLTCPRITQGGPRIHYS